MAAWRSRTHGAPKRPTTFATALVLVWLAAPFVGPAAAAPAPLNADITVFSENFDGAFPGGSWTVADNDPANGTDMWASSGQRTYLGPGSAWASGAGTQTLYWNALGTPAQALPGDPFSDGFENSTYGVWNVADYDPDHGDDYWNFSSFRSHNGTQSMWASGVGYNDDASDFNVNVHLFDNNQSSILWRPVNLARLANINATAAILDFWYFLASENGFDFLHVVYNDSTSWQTITSFTGDSSGWQEATVAVPPQATAIGFLFVTDFGGVLEGAYIDDVVLVAEHDEPNQALRTYDVNQNATMTRAVNVSTYATATLEYRYWIDSDIGSDVLSAAYQSGGLWTYLDPHSGASGGWQFSSVQIPQNTTRIGFRFLTDGSGHREGAYLDNVSVVGHVLSINCSATVSATTGYEAATFLNFSGSATQGLPPYFWQWNFSDGFRPLVQNTTHNFTAAGNYTINITVSDSAGQTCTASTPTIVILHDTTAVSITPSPSPSTIEGGVLSFVGRDRQGHALPLNWSLSPSSCGSLSTPSGLTVNVTTSLNAGGLLCTLTGAFGGVSASVPFNVTHNVSRVTLTPPSASVIEGGSIAFSAADANDHALNFTWSSSCGNLSIRLGPSTQFNATDGAGTVCRVVATIISGSVTGTAIANVTVLQDASTLSLFPSTSILTEGAALDLAAYDRFNRPIEVNWSVSPTACGSLSVAAGNATRFTSTTDAGGLTCTVTGLPWSGVRADSVITVLHDLNTISLLAGAAVLDEGFGTSYSLVDTYGHPYSASWSVAPTSCGGFFPTTGGTVNFSAAANAGGRSCTVTANVGASAWNTNLSIVHGAASQMVLTPLTATAAEGSTVSLSAFVADAQRHELPQFEVDWLSSCAQMVPSSGPNTTATLSTSGGGSTCSIRATSGALVAIANITVTHAGPFTVIFVVQSPNVASGETRELAATVQDNKGHFLPNATITWTASCGQLSSTTGSKVTWTAPSDLGGASCTITAATDEGGAAATSPATLTTPMSMLLPLMGIIPVVLGVVLFLWRRKNRPPPPPKPAKATEIEEPKPTFEVDIR